MFNTGLPIKYLDAGSSAVSGAATGATLGSIVPGVGTLLGGGVGGLVGLGVGLFGHKKAKDLLANNPRPNEPLPIEISDNLEMAKGMAQNGLPSEQYQQAKKNIQNSQAAAIAGATDRRSGNGSVSAIQQGTDNAYGGLDVANAEARRQNQLNLQGVNNQVGSFKNKLFDWNERQKYIERENYGQSLLGASNQNIVGGIDRLASGIIGYGAQGGFSRGNTANTGLSPTPQYSTSAMNMSTAPTSTPAGSVANRYPYLDPGGFNSSSLIGG